MQSPPLRIALVRLSALGDIINAAVVIQPIRSRFPKAQIDWFADEQFAAILQPHPQLDAVHTVPLKRIKRTKSVTLLRQTIRQLRTLAPYDHVIDLQGLFKSALTARLLGPVHGFDAASAREGIAARFYRTTSAIPYEANIIDRNTRLVADALDLDIDRQTVQTKIPTLDLPPRPPFLTGDYVAVVVGASWPSKCYPREKLADVCRALPLPALLVWGSVAEQNDARWIAEHADNAAVAPQTSLAELRALIGHARLTLGGDTGPTHLAWALNRPSVTLYGPTTPRMMFETPINVAIESDSAVDIRRINRRDMSIASIEPERIARRIKELL